MSDRGLCGVCSGCTSTVFEQGGYAIVFGQGCSPSRWFSGFCKARGLYELFCRCKAHNVNRPCESKVRHRHLGDFWILRRVDLRFLNFWETICIMYESAICGHVLPSRSSILGFVAACETPLCACSDPPLSSVARPGLPTSSRQF